MITYILITIYLMIGSYLVGKEEYRGEYLKWFEISVSLLCVVILPILYLFDFVKYILIEFRKYFDLRAWWKYYTNKEFGKNFQYDTIEFIKNSKPKHKLEKLLRKKLLKRINHE